MRRNKDSIPLKEAISMHIWAAKQWWKIDPKLFTSTALHALAKNISPYVTIWFSAQLINELAGQRDPNTLWKWVFLTLIVTTGLNLLTAFFEHRCEAVHSIEFYQEQRMQTVKMMDMDFSAIESPQTEQLRWSMKKHMMGNVYGFINVHKYFLEYLVGGFASVFGAITLTVSLFSRKVPESSGAMTILNHPLVLLATICILLVGVALSPFLQSRATKELTKLWQYSNKGNRVMTCYHYFGIEKSRAQDVRMYNQQTIAKNAILSTELYAEGSPAIKILCHDHGRFSVAAQVVSVLLTGVIYVFVCMKAWAGAFGIGSVTQYVGAITQVCTGLSDLLNVLGQLSFNAAYLRDIKGFMDIPNDMYLGSLPTEKRDDREYEVEFRDVSFKYPKSDIWALRHVNMKFKISSRLAVVGMNGSGKTTFIKLLCRMYDPTEGQILLNGIDIRKYQYDDYLNIFSVVFQDFRLLALPLGENVAASAEYDRDRAEMCLRKAGFGERLDSLPKGLDTYLYKEIDKEGVSISGGEAQKIAIARALYKDAPFIILDEPTAALDPIAEAEIYEKFNEIAGDKTAIYISHRLSSCKFCDEIAVFDNGSVIRQGTHEQLLAEEGGKYYELWHAQAQYYTDNP